MPLEKDNIYEFGFGRSDSVSKNVNLLDEAVFSFIYGGLFKTKYSFIKHKLTFFETLSDLPNPNSYILSFSSGII
jgi:hypothetical protein